MPSKIFLHGGGDEPECRRSTFGLFAASALREPTDKLALVIAEAVETAAWQSWQAYSTIFTSLGVPIENLVPLFVTSTAPLTYQMIARAMPSGLFVCGGVTPYYHQAAAKETSWTAYLHKSQIPYGGRSAGAAIAASEAILGTGRLPVMASCGRYCLWGRVKGLSP